MISNSSILFENFNWGFLLRKKNIFNIYKFKVISFSSIKNVLDIKLKDLEANLKESLWDCDVCTFNQELVNSNLHNKKLLNISRIYFKFCK